MGSRPTLFAKYALAVAAGVAVLVYLGLAGTRLAYPFELEWQEGGVLDHVRRIASGESLYAEPSLEFIAFPYTPFYFYVCALVAKLTGVELVALRVVSVGASLACLGLIFRLARNEGGSALAGLVSAGLFAAAYRFAGAWLDVGRVDSLFLALALGGFSVLRGRRGVPAAVFAGTLFCLATLTKQSALGMALPLLVPALWRSRAEGLAFGATLLVGVGGSTILFDAFTDGWYRWYVFELLAGHPWEKAQILGFWTTLLTNVGVALCAPIWAYFSLPRRATARRAPFFSALVVGFVGVAWISRAHVGGYDNTFLPACAAAAIVFGPVVARALAAGGRPALVAVYAGLAQFALLAYDPRDQVPTAADRAAGEHIVSTLEAIAGDVFAPYQGYLAQRAGKPRYAHAMAILDLLQGDDEAVAIEFTRSLEAALAERRFGAVVLAIPWERDMPALGRFYGTPERLFDSDATLLFRPVTGAPYRPELIYRPR